MKGTFHSQQHYANTQLWSHKPHHVHRNQILVAYDQKKKSDARFTISASKLLPPLRRGHYSTAITNHNHNQGKLIVPPGLESP